MNYVEVCFGTGKNPGFLVGRNLALSLIAALRIFAIVEVDVPLELLFFLKENYIDFIKNWINLYYCL